MATRPTVMLAAALGLGFAVPGFVVPAAACPAKIGATLALTGSNATFGGPIGKAAGLAVEQLQAAGWKVGDCGKLELLIRDNQTQPSVGVDAARRLIDLDHVAAIVGPVSSGVTGPILTSVTVERNVLMIAAASSSPTFTELGRQGKTKGLFFRTLPSDALQAVAAAMLAWDAGYRKMAVVNLNNDWGNNLSRAFVRTFKGLGGTITDHLTYNAEQPSYRAAVTRALGGKPDSLYLAASIIDGSKILRDWLSLGGPRKFVFPLGMNDAKLIANIGEKYLEDAWFLTPGTPKPNSRDLFYRAYEKRYDLAPGKGVGPGRDSGYDAAALIGLAMVSARSYTDGRKIAAAVYNLIDPKGTPIHATPEDYAKAIALLSAGKTIRYIGATGPMTFDKYGDVTTPFVGWRVEGGKYVPKKTLSTEAVAAVKRKTGG